MEIAAGNFMNNLLSNISSIEALRMKSTHGNPRNTKTKYQIDANAEFHSSMKSEYLKGLSFGIQISGVNLEFIKIHFLHDDNQCRHEPESGLDYISTEMKRLAQKMPGETEPFYENKVVALDNHRCKNEDFLMHSIELTYMEGANDRSIFRTTIKWEFHDGLLHSTLHTVTALLKFEDFVKILFN